MSNVVGEGDLPPLPVHIACARFDRKFSHGVSITTVEIHSETAANRIGIGRGVLPISGTYQRDVSDTPALDGGLQRLDPLRESFLSLTQQSEQSLVVHTVGESVPHREQVFAVVPNLVDVESDSLQAGDGLGAATGSLQTERTDRRRSKTAPKSDCDDPSLHLQAPDRTF